jgi:Ca2+-binding EF-hand superfamily protein
MKTGLIAGAIACALAAAVHADTTPPRPLVGGHGNNVESFVAQHDGNADASLTWQEFETFRRTRYDATDANRNGTVDVEEYVQEFQDRLRQQFDEGRAAEIEQTQRRYGALDADKDGKVSRAEFDASGERVWTEGSKVLAEAKAKQSADGKEKPGEAAARFDRGGNRLGMPTSHTAPGFLALFDGNGDGDVTRAEFDAARDAQFKRTDTTADGALTEDEYLAEFEDRLDRHAATATGGSDKQTRVRFESMDADKDGKLTFAEYQVSGKRTFETSDRNHDGVVDAADAKLPPPPRPERAADGRRSAN